jgi:glycosyltransferase involved in cell wall biosynthesis
MRGAAPIAFYAPMKSPDHPAPSGDRTMARLLMNALRLAGFAPTLASGLRTWDGAGDAAFQRQAKRDSLAEANRLAAAWRDGPASERPRLWFTYHVYYKAPDWIGPRAADALGIPYVVAEASRAGRRARGPWTLGHQGAEAALDRADVIFTVTEADRESLDRGRPERQQVIDFPPFIDLMEWAACGAAFSPLEPGALDSMAKIPRLLAVAMMRAGDKLASYRLLARALAGAEGEPWTLDIVGDGDARGEVEGLFTGLRERVTFHGGIEDRERLAALYRAADLLVWPAVNEAYGMVFLEAQAFGCPVLAGAYGGVASVVRDGETGVLAAPGDASAFADALSSLIRDAARRRELGEAARRFVATERDIAQAASRLRETLMPVMAETVPP